MTTTLEKFCLEYANLSLMPQTSSEDPFAAIKKAVDDAFGSVVDNVQIAILKTALIAPFLFGATRTEDDYEKIRERETCNHLYNLMNLEAALTNLSEPVSVRLAADAAYGYTVWKCETCGQGRLLPEALQAMLFKDESHVRCFECDLVYFGEMLTQLTTGKSPDRVPSLQAFIDRSDHLKICAIVTKDGIIEQISFSPVDHKTQISALNLKARRNTFYRDVVGSFVAYSLRKLLAGNRKNHLKLRLCEQCDKFALGSRIRRNQDIRQFCSQQCKDVFHREDRKTSKPEWDNLPYMTRYMRNYPRQ